MATAPISSISTPPTSLTPTTQGPNSLSPTDFYKLLIQELQSQDPLKPTDSNQLVQQMSTIQQMSMSNTLNSTLTSFADQQRIGEASNMIGRYVTGTVHSADGRQTAQVQGVVVGVQFGAAGDAVLQLHTGDQLPVKGVTSVVLVDPSTLNALTSGTPSTSDASNPPAGAGTNSLTAARRINPPQAATTNLLAALFGQDTKATSAGGTLAVA